MQVIAYGNRIELILEKESTDMRGFLRNIDTSSRIAHECRLFFSLAGVFRRWSECRGIRNASRRPDDARRLDYIDLRGFHGGVSPARRKRHPTGVGTTSKSFP